MVFMYENTDFILARGIIIFCGPCQHQIMSLDKMMEALLYLTHFYICCIWNLSIYSFTFFWISWIIIFWKYHMSHIKDTDSFIKLVVTQTLTPMHSQKTQFHEIITQHARRSPSYSRLYVFTYLSMIKPFSLCSYSHTNLILDLLIIHGSVHQCNVSESSPEQRSPPVTPDYCHELVNMLFVPSASCDLEG